MNLNYAHNTWCSKAKLLKWNAWTSIKRTRYEYGDVVHLHLLLTWSEGAITCKYLAMVPLLLQVVFSYLGRESGVFISEIEPFSTKQPLRGMRCKYAKKRAVRWRMEKKSKWDAAACTDPKPQGHTETETTAYSAFRSTLSIAIKWEKGSQQK